MPSPIDLQKIDDLVGKWILLHSTELSQKELLRSLSTGRSSVVHIDCFRHGSEKHATELRMRNIFVSRFSDAVDFRSISKSTDLIIVNNASLLETGVLTSIVKQTAELAVDTVICGSLSIYESSDREFVDLFTNPPDFYKTGLYIGDISNCYLAAGAAFNREVLCKISREPQRTNERQNR